jgi:hypothetical protein
MSESTNIAARMKEEHEAFVAYQRDHAGPRSWPDDFVYENGCYENVCAYCSHRFLGHKRRGVCRVCDRALMELL